MGIAQLVSEPVVLFFEVRNFLPLILNSLLVELEEEAADKNQKNQDANHYAKTDVSIRVFGGPTLNYLEQFLNVIVLNLGLLWLRDWLD